MKVNKNQLVQLLADQILKEVSIKIKILIREELEVEKQILRKKLLEEFKGSSVASVTKARPKIIGTPLVKQTPPSSKKIMTGDTYIDDILSEIKIDQFEPSDENSFESSTPFEQATQKIITEQRNPNRGELWKPNEGEGYNFDPKTMDPTAIDWSAFVDAVDSRTSGHLPQ
jgi:hypothetical protein